MPKKGRQTEVSQGVSSLNWRGFQLNTATGLNLRLGFTQGISGMGVAGYKEIVHGQEGIVTHSEGEGKACQD